MHNNVLTKLFGLTMALFLAVAALGFATSPAAAAPTLQEDEPEEIES
jgi:hypothetical protein